MRRKEEKLARENSDTSPSKSLQVKPQQLLQLQQHLRSPVRGSSSQQSQSSPSTSPNATSPVKDYTPIPMKRPEISWTPKTSPEEKPSSALKNSKITSYFVMEKDPPNKSPHFINTNVPPKPQDLGNVARKINFDAKSTSPTKTPSITLSKHDSNLSNGKYDANTQTDESQNMEEDNPFDLSALCDPSQPPTQLLNNNSTTKTQPTKNSQQKLPSRVSAPSASPKKTSPAPPKKTPVPTPTKPAVPSSTARKDAGTLNKFYHNDDVETQTDDSAMLSDSTGNQSRSLSSLRGSNGPNNNTKSPAASTSVEEEDAVEKKLRLQTKQKLQSLSYKSNDDDDDQDEETSNLKKSSLLKEDEVSFRNRYFSVAIYLFFRNKKATGGEIRATKQERSSAIPATTLQHFISHPTNLTTSLRPRSNIGRLRKTDLTKLYFSNKATFTTCSDPTQVHNLITTISASTN